MAGRAVRSRSESRGDVRGPLQFLSDFARGEGEEPGTKKSFSAILRDKGFEAVTIGRECAKGFKGLKLNRNPDSLL